MVGGVVLLIAWAALAIIPALAEFAHRMATGLTGDGGTGARFWDSTGSATLIVAQFVLPFLLPSARKARSDRMDRRGRDARGARGSAGPAGPAGGREFLEVPDVPGIPAVPDVPGILDVREAREARREERAT
jgi:hypothetical protein